MDRLVETAKKAEEGRAEADRARARAAAGAARAADDARAAVIAFSTVMRAMRANQIGRGVLLRKAHTASESLQLAEQRAAAANRRAALRAAESASARTEVADLQARVDSGDESARGPLAFQRGLLDRMTARTAA